MTFASPVAGRLRIALPLALLAAALGSAGVPRAADEPGLPLARAETVGMSSPRLQRVRAFVQQYIDANQIAGAVTLVARKGKVVHFESQGWRYKEEQAPMDKDAIFSLMSMTKPIVSVALMMLWEEGKFMLDDPISKWLPSYANKMVTDTGPGQLAVARPVTVRHVLTHTSGLSLTSTSYRAPAGAAAATTPAKTLLEAIERAAPIPLAFQPGDRWQYGSSTDYVAILVEKVSGMSIDQFLRQRIFEPLGMRDTHYNIPKEKVGRVAAIYRPDDKGKIVLSQKPEYREPTTYFPGVAGLSGTAADYFKFCQMLLNGGEYNNQRLLGRMTVNMMISNQIGTGKPVYVRGDGFGFGLGFGILVDPSKAPDALSIGSFMWGGANGTIFWVDPVEDLIGIQLIQIAPYNHFNIRPLFSVVVSQAITDSLANQKPTIMGYATPH
jgi:CubicO group peptidase (beta-lactamase class C family)